MKKLLERNEILIHLCQQILKLLIEHSGSGKSLILPQPVFLSVQETADRCLVSTRQVQRWVKANKITPQKWIGASPYFALDYIEDVLNTGSLRLRRRRK